MAPSAATAEGSRFQYRQLHDVATDGPDWLAYRDMQISNNVSAKSPDWMKSAFHSNRRFFEEIGPQPKRDDGKPFAGSSTAWIGRGKAAKRVGHVHQETGKVFSSGIVSVDSPDFMKSPFESNREFFMKDSRIKVQEFNPNAALSLAKQERAAGVHSEHRRGDKGRLVGMVQETGRVCNATVVSVASPPFMKSPFESNRPFFESQGVAQKLKPSVGKSHDGVFTTTIGGSKRLNLVNEETGRVYNGTIVSRDAPFFMKSPFESNREHFNAAGISQTLRASGTPACGRAAGVSTMHQVARKLGTDERPKSAPTARPRSASKAGSRPARSSASSRGSHGGGHRHHGQSARPATAPQRGHRGGGRRR